VRHFRRCLETEGLKRAEQQDKNREVTYRWDDDGSLLLSARLPAEVGALVLKALEGAMQDNPARFDMVEHYAQPLLHGMGCTWTTDWASRYCFNKRVEKSALRTEPSCVATRSDRSFLRLRQCTVSR